ncbi:MULTISPECIES: serine/threonine-protein kinase [unclassified Bradyrhizobium]|uniref:serine/threonine-protein kinase n=1 Tax=unclassified Bradyrhizobium TaxID=2631580 RepID=UPI001CD301EC|nr:MULTISPECIES: serine/threonine-protein kinase [unclassified Bradyrhizobium]MCA1363837.1 serine/threonine protein kinase [Bradyrhizobium sp. IC4059]MCA1499554.1 serine/threonine protein kinase [Bradyrhizobium sp. NBAIM14]MCA1521098.1 serine/threonine protein kinase [Bradyrhizobium sp. IC3069]
MQLAPGDQIGPKYTTKQHLGQGSFGTVYEMRDNLLARDCALKFVENTNPTEFKAHYEGQILHKCKHDNIVGVNSVDVLQAPTGELYAAIDMEYCRDGSVQDLLVAEFISIRRSLKILIDTCFGLEHAHRQSILHRDIKPANILVAGNRYKLSDFGLAKTELLGSGAGTRVYLAPEVWNNITNVSTEVYSAGMTLFQLCNNYPDLHTRVTIGQVKAGKVIEVVGYRDYVPRRLKTICNKACALDPDRRYKTIEEMRQAIERLRVAQNWELKADLEWIAQIGQQHHQMRCEGTGPVNCIYLVNGRRKNANCRIVADVDAARLHQHQWVAGNTLS